MTTIDIKDEDLTLLKDKVILITGGSSGIGLASVKLFLSLGAKVVVGDVNPCPISSDNLTYQVVDVTDWKSQLQLFKKAIEVYGHVDHVFANAGIAQSANYMEEDLDSNGDLLPPNNKTIDVNLIGVIYTCKLGIYHLKKNPNGGSVLITASGASINPFALTDYNVAKHGVLGLMRGLGVNLDKLPNRNIRINSLAPLWTATGMVPEQKMADIGVATQTPDAVARSAALLMADTNRHAQVVLSKRGQFVEIGQALLQTGFQLCAPEPQDMPKDAETGARMIAFLTGKEDVKKL